MSQHKFEWSKAGPVAEAHLICVREESGKRQGAAVCGYQPRFMPKYQPMKDGDDVCAKCMELMRANIDLRFKDVESGRAVVIRPSRRGWTILEVIIITGIIALLVVYGIVATHFITKWW